MYENDELSHACCFVPYCAFKIAQCSNHSTMKNQKWNAFKGVIYMYIELYLKSSEFSNVIYADSGETDHWSTFVNITKELWGH